MRFVICYLLFVICCPDSYSQVKLTSSAQKKIDKTIGLLWQGIDVKKEQVKVTDAMLKGSFLKISAVDLYTLKENQNLLGYAYVDEAQGKAEDFSYVVFFKPD